MTGRADARGVCVSLAYRVVNPRTIDWKVTARTRMPHVRVYTEERDRPAILIVTVAKSMRG